MFIVSCLAVLTMTHYHQSTWSCCGIVVAYIISTSQLLVVVVVTVSLPARYFKCDYSYDVATSNDVEVASSDTASTSTADMLVLQLRA